MNRPIRIGLIAEGEAELGGKYSIHQPRRWRKSYRND